MDDFLATDAEVQAEVSKIADGLKISHRFTVGNVTDTYLIGGDYAPGRARWVQTDARASAAEQAAALAASLQ
jgi:hypothetical protein